MRCLVIDIGDSFICNRNLGFIQFSLHHLLQKIMTLHYLKLAIVLLKAWGGGTLEGVRPFSDVSLMPVLH